MEIIERIQQLEKDDPYGIQIRLSIIKDIVKRVQINIKNNEALPMIENDKLQLNALRKDKYSVNL